MPLPTVQFGQFDPGRPEFDFETIAQEMRQDNPFLLEYIKGTQMYLAKQPPDALRQDTIYRFGLTVYALLDAAAKEQTGA